MLHYLDRNPEPPEEPISNSFHAAVLFADMQNFTLLAERLTGEDPRQGVKKLTGYLDIYIGRLVNIITECGGDIVKFAGDAVFAIWPAAATAGLSHAIRMAATCGLTIQKQLHNYPIDEDVTLALRVGVGAGTLYELHLGGYLDRWEYVFAGSPMGQAGHGGTLAEPGQVMIAPQAWRSLQNAGLGEKQSAQKFRMQPLPPEDRPTLSRIEIPEPARTAFNVYIPRAVLVGDLEDSSGELRPITALFCKVRNLQFTADLPVQVVQIIMLVMQECIYRYEGSINRLGVDEKGTILLAAFGLPPLVHEDDPVRGIRAALDLRQALAASGHDAAVGVATGRAFCGTVGNEVRCEYTMHGTNVNLAARLMVHADTVLVDENTYQAAKDVDGFEFEKREPLTVKGRDTAVMTYIPHATKK